MWDLIVSVPDHCLSFYFVTCFCLTKQSINKLIENVKKLQFLLNSL